MSSGSEGEEELTWEYGDSTLSVTMATPNQTRLTNPEPSAWLSVSLQQEDVTALLSRHTLSRVQGLWEENKTPAARAMQPPHDTRRYHRPIGSGGQRSVRDKYPNRPHSHHHPSNFRDSVICYNCGGRGHIARKCVSPPYTPNRTDVRGAQVFPSRNPRHYQNRHRPVSPCAACRPIYVVVLPDTTWERPENKNKNANSRVVAGIHARTGSLNLQLLVGTGEQRVTVFAMLDTGACVSLIDEELFIVMGGKIIDGNPIHIQGSDRSPIANRGIAEVVVDLGHGEIKEKFVVVTNGTVLPTPVVLGFEFMWRQDVTVEALSQLGQFQVTVRALPVQLQSIPDEYIGDYPTPTQSA